MRWTENTVLCYSPLHTSTCFLHIDMAEDNMIQTAAALNTRGSNNAPGLARNQLIVGIFA